MVPLENFFESRIAFLKNMKKNSEILIDAQFKLQPNPSIDFSLFNVDILLSEKKSVKPLKMSAEGSKIKTGVMISYNMTDGTFTTSDPRYAYSKVPENRLVKYAKLLHDAKSSGLIKFENITNSIITFKGMTGMGSAGSPIQDSEGSIFAMNFGNYDDMHEREKENLEEIPSVNYEANVEEDTGNYKKEKNANLALSIFHPFIKEYFANMKLEKIGKEEKKQFLGKKRENEKMSKINKATKEIKKEKKDSGTTKINKKTKANKKLLKE